MPRYLSHAIIQYSPHPTSHERINVGVMVFSNQTRDIIVRYIQDFGHLPYKSNASDKRFMEIALRDYIRRCAYEFRSKGSAFSASALNAKKAGLFLLTEIMPVDGNEANFVADRLYRKVLQDIPWASFDIEAVA